MKMSLITSLTLIMLSSVGSIVHARGGSASSGILLTANLFMYNTTEERTPGGTSNGKESIYDIKLGYLTGTGLYLGGIYTLRNSEVNSTTFDGNAAGASLGYMGTNGFYLMGHYLLTATDGYLKEGSGIQADFGYMTEVSSSFMVGVELTYRSLDYKKDDTNSAITKVNRTELMPMLTLGLVF